MASLLLKDLLLEGYIRIEKSESDLTVADGEAGRGIYFSLADYPEMIDYYKRHSGSGYRVIQAVPTFSAKIVDLTGSNLQKLLQFMAAEINGLARRMPGYVKPAITRTNYQRFGRLIEMFIAKQFPNSDAYIVNHSSENSSIPEGKQLIIKNEAAFKYREME